MSSSSSPTFMQNLQGAYQSAKSAYSNYQGASGIKGSSVYATAKHAYQHSDETAFGALGGPKTYGVKPFSHPSYTYSLVKDVSALRKQSSQMLDQADKFYSPEARSAYSDFHPPWG